MLACFEPGGKDIIFYSLIPSSTKNIDGTKLLIMKQKFTSKSLSIMDKFYDSQNR